jgi:hypothetical protein
MSDSVGILAYGSLIGNPGSEIEKATRKAVSGVKTPFRVEFARGSRGRGGAPTLVPVESGGCEVPPSSSQGGAAIPSRPAAVG